VSTKHKDRNKLTQNFHAHHIVPKHFGGSDRPENLVLLHPIDHAIWHLVRAKMYKSKADYAAAKKIQSHLTQDETFPVDLSGKNNPMFGVKRNDLSEYNKTRKNPLQGKSGGLSKTSKPLCVEFTNGDVVFTEVGSQEFARQLGMPEGTMSYCISTGQAMPKYNIKHAWRP
jgi:hypothetical protein